VRLGWSVITEFQLHLRHQLTTHSGSDMARTRKPASSSKLQSLKKVAQSTEDSVDTTSTAQAGNTVTALKEASANNRQAFCKSSRTRGAYEGQVTHGKEFLASCIAERREKGMDSDSDGIKTNLLEKAFDCPPNEHSVDALELFLAQKCFKDGRGYSTAEAIHTAFVDYWDNM
jgi:HPt (histidine-containing phosphotransfer) domain-containing protein